ncbi:hypothetical protein SAMN04487910_3420 [Aquimarina amphilecti]|uniref:Uncharacterized protein n=1 Tax=Aquimarina amphilecti TaxID=1038014 RepID=A0A1H7TG80_AQUAM|nr:hypothetical protein [Aquimarina amphilecti]SEL83713.1 hypothetical protein SAMN04487910_3420 [Aquimarina amphilecti]
MSNEFEALQSQWQKSKNNIKGNSPNSEEMFSLISKKKSWSTRFHYGNIIILSLVLIGIMSFFYFVAPVQELLSRVGAGFMIGGLFIRILIEFISVSKAKKINMVDDALQTTNDTIAFYNFRKKIHGPITIGIIVLYTLGFYMITPEFSLYFETWQMVLIDISYIIGAIIPYLAVRKNIKKEINVLLEIIELKRAIIGEVS